VERRRPLIVSGRTSFASMESPDLIVLSMAAADPLQCGIDQISRLSPSELFPNELFPNELFLGHPRSHHIGTPFLRFFRRDPNITRTPRRGGMTFLRRGVLPV